VPRIAFVGQRIFFELTSLEHATDGLEPLYIDFRQDADARALREQLEAFDPDVIWVWRPEIVPAGLLKEFRAVKVGYLTEPLPRPGDEDPHSDLTTRDGYMRATDKTQYDRIISFDPLVVPTVEQHMPVWRSLPIPASDSLFQDDFAHGEQIAFLGRSTEHRERFLGPAKHDFDVVHVVHGFTGQRFIDLLQESSIVLNLHNEDYPTFENRVTGAMATGAMVISEPLSPTHGLRPGTDYVEVRTPWDLWRTLAEFRRTPEAFHATRASGRREAERFRASKVFPRVVADLLA
jgi:hypothetical protein